MGLEERKQTVEIDGTVYEITPVPFGVGRPALMRLIRIISPIFAAAMKQQGRDAAIGAVFEALPTALADEDVVYFEKLFGPYSQFQHGSEWIKLVDAQRELHFAGRYLVFARWLVACMRCNFGDFFIGITSGDAFGGLVQMMAAPTRSTL